MATAKSNRTKAPAVAVAVPVDRDDCARYLTNLGELIRRHNTIKATYEASIAALRDEAAPILAAVADEINALLKGVQVWCEGNRAAITNGYKTKTVNLVTGEVGWRQLPPKISARDVEGILKSLREMALGDYIRTEESLNKEALLALASAVDKLGAEDMSETAQRLRQHWALVSAIRGLSVIKGVEDFFATPAELVAEVSA
jgi:phage host-nuclease inhibitor protein Gam